MTPRVVRRVIVFIDYQNVYEDFRRAFGPGSKRPTDGQFWPDALARLIVARGPAGEIWELAETRVYLGRAAPDKNPRAAAAHDRQTQAWRDRGIVVRARPLQYLRDQPPRQKGVDVELAVDAVRFAEAAHDVGVIASTDSDLLPAIDAVELIRGLGDVPRICVVEYSGVPKRLRLRDGRARQLWAFRLTATDYGAVHDQTVYVRRTDDPQVSDV